MKSKAVFTRYCILQGAYWAFQAAMVGYYTAYVIRYLLRCVNVKT